MELRRFDVDRDFDCLCRWSSEKRVHALWCAGRFRYPLEKESFKAAFEQLSDTPFIAMENGEPVGFFCLSRPLENGSIMLKFVIVDPELRGKGIGRKMLRLACDHAFAEMGVPAVSLNVFSVNEAARRCYRSAGFTEISVTEGAFRFGDEIWDRCSMVFCRED